MFSARRLLPVVCASAACIRSRICALKRPRSPMKRTRTPRRCSSTTSRSSALRNSFMRAPTSSSGRPQFSLEKANSVSAEIPRSRQKSMHRLTARAPARWPIIRGRRRCAAHRPLPSMMTARWRGRVMERPGMGNREWGTGEAGTRHARRRTGRPRAFALPIPDSRLPIPGSSYGHQFLFLGLNHLVDVLDALVGELLDLVAAAALVVLGDLLLLEQILDLLDRVAADIADRDLGVL